MFFKKPDGKLIIDLYGDGPTMNLRINHDIYGLVRKKKLVLTVETVGEQAVLTEESEEQ